MNTYYSDPRGYIPHAYYHAQYPGNFQPQYYVPSASAAPHGTHDHVPVGGQTVVFDIPTGRNVHHGHYPPRRVLNITYIAPRREVEDLVNAFQGHESEGSYRRCVSFDTRAPRQHMPLGAQPGHHQQRPSPAWTWNPHPRPARNAIRRDFVGCPCPYHLSHTVPPNTPDIARRAFRQPGAAVNTSAPAEQNSDSEEDGWMLPWFRRRFVPRYGGAQGRPVPSHTQAAAAEETAPTEGSTARHLREPDEDENDFSSSYDDEGASSGYTRDLSDRNAVEQSERNNTGEAEGNTDHAEPKTTSDLHVVPEDNTGKGKQVEGKDT